MATPTRDTANVNTTNNRSAIESMVDQDFIDSATVAILDQIDLGLFQVVLSTHENCNIQVLHDYFVALGYGVSYVGLGMLPSSVPAQPAALFGIQWTQFWGGVAPELANPVRMLISWK